MQAFYKFLAENGEVEGFPFADRDLIFFVEAQKFKVSSSFRVILNIFAMYMTNSLWITQNIIFGDV
jgi:hypothetical protein